VPALLHAFLSVSNFFIYVYEFLQFSLPSILLLHFTPSFFIINISEAAISRVSREEHRRTKIDDEDSNQQQQEGDVGQGQEQMG
jgi:hypothetical protein